MKRKCERSNSETKKPWEMATILEAVVPSARGNEARTIVQTKTEKKKKAGKMWSRYKNIAWIYLKDTEKVTWPLNNYNCNEKNIHKFRYSGWHGCRGSHVHHIHGDGKSRYWNPSQTWIKNDLWLKKIKIWLKNSLKREKISQVCLKWMMQKVKKQGQHL